MCNSCHLHIWLATALLALLLSACSGERPGSTTGDADSTATDSLPTPEELLGELDAKIKYSPDEPNLYYQRAQLHWTMGDSVSAIKDAVRSMQLDSLNPTYPELLGFFYYATAKDTLAESVLERAVQLESENPEPYHQLATLASMRGDYQLALNRHNQALAYAPDSAIYLLGKAHTLRRAKRPMEAKPLLEQALTRDSLNTKVLSELFELHFFDLGEPDKAVSYNDRIFSLTPRHPLGHYNLGQVYFRKYQQAKTAGSSQAERHLNAALNSYNSAIASDPDFAKALYGRGYVQFEKGEYDNALADFKLAAQHDPRDHRTQFMLGSLYEYYDDRTQAIRHYRRALELLPGFTEARQALRELGAP